MKILKLVALVLLMPLLGLANVTSQTAKTGPFIISGLPQTIPVGFPFQQATDLLVLDYGTSAVTHDPALVLVRGSDYTVTGGGYNASTQMQTGSIVVSASGVNNVQVGDNIVILRNSPLNQTNSFSTTGPLTIALIEQTLDKMATLSQQVNELGQRSLHFENFESNSGLMPLSARKGRYPFFDDSGNLTWSSGTGSGGGGTYTNGPGLLLASNVFSVDPSQSLTDLTVTNPIVGNITGNAATATVLATPRNINGVAFDGSGNVTVPAAAGTLTGTSINSTVTAAPGLLSASVGTFGNMAIQNANSVAITGGAITGMSSPVAGSDVANKTYVDSVATGITLRTGVLVATTANITLSGEQTIDGVLTSTSRILVKNQSTTANNGIYVTAAGAWSRASDSDTAAELKVGYYYFVSSGTTQQATGWVISTAPTVLNTDPVLFSQFSASTSYTAGTNLSLIGNVFSIPATIIGQNLTSSSFNGTIGATTPSTALFTTETVSGNSYLANLVVKSGQVDETATNATASVDINFDGYNGGTTQFRDLTVYDGKNAQVAKFTGSTKSLNVVGGINTTNIGATTPGTGAFTALSGSTTSTGSVTSRTLAARGNDVTNVLDYGADPTGVADSATALAAAVTAVPSARGVLYFPAGRYKWSSASTFTISGKTNLTIIGAGAELYDNSTASARPFVTIDKTNSYVTLSGLAFNGNAAARVAGAHQFILNASHSIVSDCSFTNGSQFTFYIGSDSSQTVTDVAVSNCLIDNTWADGFHIWNAQYVDIGNCVVTRTADDGCGIIADTAGTNPKNILIHDNIFDHNGGNHTTTTGNGVNIQEAQDVVVAHNSISNTELVPVYVTRFNSTTFTNARIKIENNDIQYGGLFGAGPYAMVDLHFVNDSSVKGNVFKNVPSTMNNIAFVNFNRLNIEANECYEGGRGIVVNDVGAAYTEKGGFSSTWDQLVVKDNICSASTNESIYLNPQLVSAVQYSITKLSVTHNTELNTSATNAMISVSQAAGVIANNWSNNSKATTLGANTSGIYQPGDVLASTGTTATLGGSLNTDLNCQLANGFASVTLPVGTWSVSGSITVRTSTGTFVTMWPVFYDNTTEYGAGAVVQAPDTATRYSLACNATVSVTSGTKAIHFRIKQGGGGVTIDAGSAAGPNSYITATRLN